MIKLYNDDPIILREAIGDYVSANDYYQSTLDWNDYLMEQEKIKENKYLKK